MLRIDFANRLFSGKSTSFRLLFDLPGAGRRAAPQVRVGESLVTVPVWAFASNGVRGSTVAVRFPKGWDVAVESGELPRRQAGDDGGTVLSSGSIAAPLRFFAYVTAQRPPTYVDREVAIPVGDATVPVVLQGWQDDPGWATRVRRQLKAALPVLAEDIGVPWSLAGPLIVREAANRDANAVAGRFDPATNTLELAYWADPAVIVRQLSHAWFNGSLLSERWANEGFASWYALRAAEALEIPMAAPTAPEEELAAVGPLAGWTGGDTLPPTAGAIDPDVAATAAAHALVAQVAERVGAEGAPGRLGGRRGRHRRLPAALRGWGHRNARDRRRPARLARPAGRARGALGRGPRRPVARLGRARGRRRVRSTRAPMPRPRTSGRSPSPGTGSSRARSATRSAAGTSRRPTP